ncbi:hypothetical protein EC968_001757 [Mortierella alpina]|nr:hypothetical protein EC968_001757 [Mortierella alpina]
MLLSARSITIALIAVVLAAVSVEAGCYRTCLKDPDMNWQKCQEACYDRACYRQCVREGNSGQFCKKSCLE